MRTVAGLIVGLTLGILLMYFSLSTVEVGRLATTPPEPAVASAAALAPGLLASRLGLAAGQAAATACPKTGMMLAVADPATPQGMAALEGFRQALATHPGLTLLAVVDLAAAQPHLNAAVALFCPDHHQLRRLHEESPAGTLPPIYTIGWSTWLLDTDHGARPPADGVAVLHPATALRLVTPRWDEAEATQPAAAVVVLTPAEVQAAFALPDSHAGPAETAP